VTGGREDGAAVVELVLLGVVLLAPLLYLVLAVSTVQRSLYGVSQAAREAGRAYATGTAANAPLRAEYAARLALADQGLPVDGVEVRYAAADADCAAAGSTPWPLAPGAVFAVCVTRPVAVPGVPGFLDGRRNTVTGRHVVHADDYRDLGSR
jgi:Flp pilus assembly protein TadG